MKIMQEAKAMAKALRRSLNDRQIDISHGASLDIVARQFGYDNWNILSAKIENGGLEGAKAPTASLALPVGWVRSGSKPDLYEMGVDAEAPDGHAMIRFKYPSGGAALTGNDLGFGTLMQSVLADSFRAQTIRLTAEMRCEEIDGAATLWLRIDRKPGQTLRFDNMEDRASQGVLCGTMDWTTRRIVLDVPEDAETIHFGFYQRGRGRTSARQFRLDVADDGDHVTSRSHPLPTKPVNLDFRAQSLS